MYKYLRRGTGIYIKDKLVEETAALYFIVVFL